MGINYKALRTVLQLILENKVIFFFKVDTFFFPLILLFSDYDFGIGPFSIKSFSNFCPNFSDFWLKLLCFHKVDSLLPIFSCMVSISKMKMGNLVISCKM